MRSSSTGAEVGGHKPGMSGAVWDLEEAVRPHWRSAGLNDLLGPRVDVAEGLS